eukprot:TRINITY_DN3309_c0_g1_i1.p1 TRINITY_DN3309_c0_g1~~TRINITY_DN3309_c0_g1_i1.p1  ORF type:complete len:413 (-),score=105.04 TRINITY_DN3309_c0_g1_i1:818-2056(-)
MCASFEAPTNATNTFCAVYSGWTCCSELKDAMLKSKAAGIRVTPESADGDWCLDQLRRLLCSQCDPWEAHLYYAETTGVARRAPWLCANYAATFWARCKSVNITWPGGDSPFDGPRLDALFANDDAFFAEYKMPTPSGACFAGEKFIPLPGMENLTASDLPELHICMEHFHPSSDFSRMLALVPPWPDSDRVFALFQNGTMAELDRSTGSVVAVVLDRADLPNLLHDWDEAGALELAFHPKFRVNGRFFVFYSASKANVTCSEAHGLPSVECNFANCTLAGQCAGALTNLLVEFQMDTVSFNRLADNRRMRIIMSVPKPWRNHNGGSLLFAPDGLLFVSTGDGGAGNDPFGQAQNLSSQLGKMLRIDVDGPVDAPKAYRVPPDNPYGNEVWAYGLRNPWRCTFDPKYRLYCG